MLKNLNQLELEIDGQMFHFNCDMDAPIHLIKEALFQFQTYVGKIQEFHTKNEKKEITKETLDG